MNKVLFSFFFIHIPKTGGVTFQYILNKKYSRSKKFTLHPFNNKKWQKFSDTQKKSFQLIKGHFRFKPDLYPGECIYFTFLRNPVSRLISHYNFIKTTPTHRFYKEINEHHYSLIQLIENGKIPNLDNCMVRFLAGVEGKKFGDVNENDLKLAIYNFDHYFNHFGILEKYDESLLILSYELGWNKPYYTKHNEGKLKENMNEKDASTNEAIAICTKYDEVLYRHALEKFNQKCIYYKLNLQRDLEEFIKVNATRTITKSIQLFIRKLIQFAQLIFVKVYALYHPFKK